MPSVTAGFYHDHVEALLSHGVEAELKKGAPNPVPLEGGINRQNVDLAHGIADMHPKADESCKVIAYQRQPDRCSFIPAS